MPPGSTPYTPSHTQVQNQSEADFSQINVYINQRINVGHGMDAPKISEHIAKNSFPGKDFGVSLPGKDNGRAFRAKTKASLAMKGNELSSR